jgi:DNA polymerase I-like protein with 3'-5' exonuclease and polymerase domains
VGAREEEGRQLLERYFSRFPQLRAYLQWLAGQAVQRGEARTL